MNALAELAVDNARKVAARFFLGIGRKARAPRFENLSRPLFGLPLVLEAEGLLRDDKERVQWRRSYRADVAARRLADRHYNRQKVGAPQFVPPGACFVLLSACERAVWVTSWPKAEYVQHEWAGAWVNSLFRREGGARASDMIRAAVAHTRAQWPDVPEQGMVSFVDPKHVKPVIRRGQAIYGYCYLKAGFHHVGFTKGGLWAWQMLPHEMPAPLPLDADAAYLSRCEALIRDAARELRA